MTGGTFRFSRNPMWGLSLVALRAALWFARARSGVHRRDGSMVHPMLREAFGGLFDDYAGRTRRWT